MPIIHGQCTLTCRKLCREGIIKANTALMAAFSKIGKKLTYCRFPSAMQNLPKPYSQSQRIRPWRQHSVRWAGNLRPVDSQVESKIYPNHTVSHSEYGPERRIQCNGLGSYRLSISKSNPRFAKTTPSVTTNTALTATFSNWWAHPKREDRKLTACRFKIPSPNLQRTNSQSQGWVVLSRDAFDSHVIWWIHSS